METRTITIRVSSEAALAYETATAEQQRKLDLLLSLKLTEVGRCKRPLETIMSEISRKAQERGLTETMLESILHEECSGGRVFLLESTTIKVVRVRYSGSIQETRPHSPSVTYGTAILQ
ncbi:MAG: hypothetical protein V1792_27955 [Pseudomonadota bacterium]